jgi:hypothetical protein
MDEIAQQEKRNKDLARNLVGGAIVVLGGFFIIGSLYYLAKR